jgi:dihydroflavonol-4-reductase
MTETKPIALATGANGFVGSHLTEALLAQGYRVRCMVRRTSDLRFVRDLPVELVYADLEDAAGLRQACQGADVVCHCAALTRALSEERFYRANTHGTILLARTCMEVCGDLRRFVFVSSQTAAGPSETEDDYVNESAVPRPITWYAKSKWAAERALLALGDQLPLTIIRPAAVFGPRDQDFLTYFSLVRRGLRLKLGRRERRISFIYVHDLVDLILLAIESDRAVGQTYFGCGGNSSYTELADLIAKALERRTIGITLPEAVLTPMSVWARVQGRLTQRPPLLNDQRVIDMRQRYWLCSGEKARRELGYVARRDMESAVRETAAWYLREGWI